MKTIFKRSLAMFLVAVMVFGAAPLSGYVGLELPNISEFTGIKKLALSVSDFFNSFAPKAEAATSGTCGENLTWTFDELTGTLTISGTGNMVDWKYNSVRWGGNETNIKNVLIENGVTSIGEYAFSNCKALKSISIPNSITSIDNSVFYNCSLENFYYLGSIAEWCQIKRTSYYSTISYAINNLYIGGKLLSGELKIPEGVTVIGSGAFYNCDNLTSVIMPDSVTSIEINAFRGCGQITNIVIGKNVREIGDYVFCDCTSLTSVLLPDNLINIGVWAFGNCLNLTSIIIPDKVKNVSDGLFSGCENLSSVIIGNSVKSIGAYAFSSCNNLTSITIPGNVLGIGAYAFNHCEKIKNINLSYGLKNIEQYAFSYTKITNITIPDSVTSIGEGAFKGCGGITSITIPSNATSIGRFAFYQCYNLTNVYLKKGLKIIGEHMFALCDKITEVIIPDSVTTIGAAAFSGCKNLASITIPESVTSIGDHAFYNTAYVADETNWENGELYIGKHLIAIGKKITGAYKVKEGTLVIADNAAQYVGDFSKIEITSLEIPDSVVTIGKSAFMYCRKLEYVKIPYSVKTIDAAAFLYCYNLTNITIENGVENIEAQAFRDTKIESITIPKSVTKIGYEAFYSCDNLVKATILCSKVSIGYDAFRFCSNLTDISIIGNATSIGIGAFSGTEYFENTSNWENNVLYINKHLIATKAYTGSYEIKAGTVLIADNAFSGCPNLTNITIPDSMKNIGNNAFKRCARLKEITIPDSVTSIGESTFEGCSGLSTITISDSMKNIGNNAFKGCTQLKEITIPDSVTSIGESAFEGCSGLSTITIPENVTNIKDRTFVNCYNLIFLMIPDATTFIGVAAFYGCANLSDVYYLGSEDDWNQLLIGSNNEALFNAAVHFGESEITLEDDELFVDVEDEIVINGKITAETDDINKIELTYEVSGLNGLKVISDTFNVTSETEADFSVKIKGLKDGKYTLTVKNGNASAKCDIIVGEISELVIQFEDIKDNLYSLNGFFFDSIGNYYNNALEVIVKLTNQVKLEYLLTEFTEKEKEDAAFKVRFVVEVNSGFSFDGAGKKQLEFVYDPLELRQSEEIKFYIHQENENAKNLTVTYKAYIDDVLKHTGTETSTIISYQEKYTLEHISALTDKKGYYPILNDSFAQKMIAQEDSKYCKWNKFLSDGLVGTAANYLTGDIDEENAYKLVIADLINGMYDQETLEEASLTIYSEAFTNVVTQAAEAIVEYALEDSYIREKLGKLGVKDIIKVFTGGASSEATAVCKAVLNTEKGKNKMLTALSGVSLVDNGLFILEEAGLILDSYNNYVRAVNAMSAMNTFAQMDKALIDVFFAMYGCSYNNPTLKKALNDYLSHMNDTRASRIFKIVKCYVDSNLTSLSKTVFKSIQMIYSYGLRDVIAKSISVFFKYAGELISGIDFGVYVFDFLWSSSDYDAAMSRAVAAGHVSVVLEKAIERLGDNIKSTKSFSNAVILDRALNLFGEVEKYAYKNYIAALNAEGNCIFLTDPLSVKLFGDRTDDYKKEIADLLTESAKLEGLNCHSLRLERIASKVTGLTPSNTSERILKPDFKIVCVRCPVDVYVYDGTTLIASIVGNKITFLADGIKALTYHDEKYICLPSTVDYDIKIEATEYGEMNYSVFEYNGEGSLTREVAYDDIELEKGQIFTGSVNDVPLTPAENYDLDTNGETIDDRKDSSDGYDFTKEIDIKIVGNTDVGLNVPTEFKLLCSNLPQEAKINWTCNDSSIKLRPADDGVSCEIVAKNAGSAVLTASIAGTDIASKLEITVSEKTYTINWYIGDSTKTQSYKYGQIVEIPNISVPEGYSFLRWSSEIPETMPAKNISIMAVLEKIKYTCPDCGDEFDNETVYNEHVSYEEAKKGAQVTIINPTTNTISYGDSIILHAELSEGLPVGWKIMWESDNDNFSYSVSDDGTTCMISPSKSGNTIFTASVYDADGNEVSTDEQTMTSKAGFFDKIIAFFKKLFGLTKTIPQVFKGII